MCKGTRHCGCTFAAVGFLVVMSVFALELASQPRHCWHFGLVDSVVGTVLFVVGCLAASLALSIHEMQTAFSSIVTAQTSPDMALCP